MYALHPMYGQIYQNEPVVNYMAVSPINSLFLEAVNTGAQGHDANWLSKDLT